MWCRNCASAKTTVRSKWCRMGCRKYDQVTSTLRDDLHWLPVESRIRFKQCTLIYKSFHGTAPVYITEICIRCSFHIERYQLRSAVRGELVVLLAKKVTLTRCSFRYAGTLLLNMLPQDIRDFLFHFVNFSLNLTRSCIAKFNFFVHTSTFVMASS